METEKKSKIWKDPASALTHFGGFIFAIVGLFLLLYLCPPDTAKVITFTIYGISLCLLFLASTAYHFFDLGENANLWLRRADHSAIFLLIGGSYVPVFFHFLEGQMRFWMLVTTAAIAIFGIIFKLTWFHAPRWLNAGMYLAMGWMIVIPGTTLFVKMDSTTFYFILIGGLFYSFGAVIYALKRPDPWPEKFGFHEIWHCFVLAGSGFHFLFVYHLLDAPYPPF